MNAEVPLPPHRIHVDLNILQDLRGLIWRLIELLEITRPEMILRESKTEALRRLISHA
jgi:hypothetical protein